MGVDLKGYSDVSNVLKCAAVFFVIFALCAYWNEMLIIFLQAISLPKESGGWLYEYQTAFTGIIGLVSVIVILHQYSDNIRRKRLSTRAKMNDALSSICLYSKNCFLSVRDQKEIPSTIGDIEVLKNSIEFLDGETANTLYALIVHYQVHNARLESAEELSPTQIQQRLYDAIKLYALSSRLFGYARNSDEYLKEVKSVANKKLTRKQMYSAFRAITDTWPDQIEGSGHANIYRPLLEYIDTFHRY